LKPERWGSPLVQEKYQEEKACDKRHPYRIIIIIIIIIYIEASNKWLTNADLFAETAIQDQVVLTRSYKKYILKHPDTEDLCRRRGKESQTIQHITTACEQLVPTEYVKRHDELAKIIHQKLAEAAELIDDKSPHYKYTPAIVLENENFCTGIAAYLRTKQYLLIDLT